MANISFESRSSTIAFREVLIARSKTRPARTDVFGFGEKAINALFIRGLRRGSLHEAIASPQEASVGVAFALLLSRRATAERTIFWIREDRSERHIGGIYPPGIAELGIDPARVVLIRANDAKALLRAAHDAAHCGAIGAIMIEIRSGTNLVDLTMTRRLMLAAERSGVTIILAHSTIEHRPSAAWTRWRIAAVPSRPLEGDAPGHPAFTVELLRDRGGSAPFTAQLEWDRDRMSFRQAPLFGSVAAVPADRADRRAV